MPPFTRTSTASTSLIALLAAAAWMLSPLHARAAATPEQIATCASTTIATEARIDACTAVIDDASQPVDVRVDALSHRGMAYEEDEEYESAIEDYDEAMKLSPNDPALLILRGNAYDGMGEPQKAIEDYTEAIRLNPGDSSPFFNRVAVNHENGDKDKARRDYKRALEIDPTYEAAKEALAELDKEEAAPPADTTK